MITYNITVPLDKLEAAIKKECKIDHLLLEDRVIFIHGIPKHAPLTSTVQPLSEVPAYITVIFNCINQICFLLLSEVPAYITVPVA